MWMLKHLADCNLCLQEYMQCKTVIFVFFNGNRVLEGGVIEKGMLILKT